VNQAPVKGVLIDLDGVIWNGSRPIPGAGEAVRRMKEAGIKVRFVSNNSGRGVDGLYEHLIRFGVPAERDEVLAASEVLARAIARKERRATVYLIGSSAFRRELEAQGLRVIDEPEEIDYLADFVVVSADRELTWKKLTSALRCLQKGAVFAAPNVDPVYPSSDGMVPGTGAVVAAVSAMVKREPDLMVGKPNPQMLLEAAKSMELSPEECLMVGDSVDSDLAAAKNAGMRSVLVLSGTSSREDVERSEYEPVAVIDSIADLPRLLVAN